MAAELPVPVPVLVAGPGPAARGAAGGAAGPPGAAGAGDPSAAGPSAAPPAPARQGAPSVFKHGTSKMWLFFKQNKATDKTSLFLSTKPLRFQPRTAHKAAFAFQVQVTQPESFQTTSCTPGFMA